jgi:hypothetical protein
MEGIPPDDAFICTRHSVTSGNLRLNNSESGAFSISRPPHSRFSGYVDSFFLKCRAPAEGGKARASLS